MNKLIIAALTLVIASCVLGKQGVFYEEMGKEPAIEIIDHAIVLTTANSSKNSALLIYTIECNLNNELKTIELKGYQALNKDYKTRFEIELKGLSKSELDGYKIYWINPDSTKIAIRNPD